MELLLRGVEQLYSEPELRRRLRLNRPLRVKLGLDPTAPDIHLGHMVQLRKLRQFQDLGHKAVLIIGDYTARVGDPSGRDTTRPVLSPEAIEANAQTYLDQAGKILRTDDDALELRRNADWLGRWNLADVLAITGVFTVNQMLHRDAFKKRMAEDREIAISEFMYPLMQAADSVEIEADVELGGTDQTFNLLVGRELMEKRNLAKQVVMTLPLLVGLDGAEKMSKSKGNYVGVSEPAGEMFGKLMSLPDEAMADYLRLLTDLPTDEIATWVDPARTHPREAKDRMARTITAMLHSEPEAAEASEAFRRQFAEGRLPDDLAEHAAPASPIGPLDLIRAVGFASSGSEARRLVGQGAVSIDGERVEDAAAPLTIDRPVVLKVGKRRVCRVLPPG